VSTSPDDNEPGGQDRREQRDRLRQLGARIGGKTPGPPPWAWPNLNPSEAALTDVALDDFVETFNRIHATVVEEVIPQCWRRHPPLAQQLPVQLWAWWASHIAVTATVATAVDYYAKTLPDFQGRLSKLLGKGAATCRKGTHAGTTDPELIKATSFDPLGPVDITHRGEVTRRTLRQIDFGTFEGATG